MRYSQFILCFFLFVGTKVYSQEIKIKNNHQKSSVIYYMSHPMHDWEGTSKEVNSVIKVDKATGQIKQVAVLIKVETFDSQNANRDSHMIEVLEGLKFPYVSFQSTNVSITGDKANLNGVLTFHGVPKEVKFQVQLKQNKEQIEASGNFVVKMSDYKIKAPSLMMVSADDNIKIHFELVYDLN